MNPGEINMSELEIYAQDDDIIQPVTGSCLELIDLIEEIMSWKVESTSLQKATVLNVIQMFKENKYEENRMYARKFNQSQVDILSALYYKNKSPSGTQLKEAARETNLTLRQVRTWFANRRKRDHA